MMRNFCNFCNIPDNSALNRKVTMFNSILDKEPYENICLGCWLTVKNEKHSQTIESIRKTSDPLLKKEYKKHLPVITPSGVFYNRKTIQEFSGLYCLDIDGKDNPHVINWDSVKSWMPALSFISYAGLSASGNGLMVLIKTHNYELQKKQYPDIKGAFLQFGIKTDNSKKGGNDLRYYSYDPKPYINHTPVCFQGKYTSYESNHNIISNNKPVETKSNLKEHVERYIANNSRGFDYKEWINLAIGLAYEFGEDGRQYFHSLSSADTNKYDFKKCDQVYSDILKRDYKGVTGGTVRFLLSS